MSRSRRAKLLLLPPLLYGCWLGMMLVHELGHVLHAWLAGGSVERVVVPLLGFSRTDVSPNPRPLFVAWGGAVWGVVLPLTAWLVLHGLNARGKRIAQFFAGFCLVANGAYLGLGWTMTAGDAADLRRHGTPLWPLVLFGVATFAAGLWLWHRLGTPALPRSDADST